MFFFKLMEEQTCNDIVCISWVFISSAESLSETQVVIGMLLTVPSVVQEISCPLHLQAFSGQRQIPSTQWLFLNMIDSLFPETSFTCYFVHIFWKKKKCYAKYSHASRVLPNSVKAINDCNRCVLHIYPAHYPFNFIT